MSTVRTPTVRSNVAAPLPIIVPALRGVGAFYSVWPAGEGTALVLDRLPIGTTLNTVAPRARWVTAELDDGCLGDFLVVELVGDPGHFVTIGPDGSTVRNWAPTEVLLVA